MRFTEVLRHILNKIIRQKPKMQPEAYQKITEVSVAGKEKKEQVQEGKPDKKPEWGERTYRRNPEKEKMIRRYRAYAYHHKKRRIRKKYLKRLLEVSTTDKFIHDVSKYGISTSAIRGNGYIIDTDYSSGKSFSRWYMGSRRSDHPDSRIEGGVR